METPKSEWEVKLAKKGTPLAIFQKERTDAISEMFNNEGESGIYPTGKFFARLDKCVSTLLQQQRNKLLKEIDDSRDHDSCECDNCFRWRRFYKKDQLTK